MFHFRTEWGRQDSLSWRMPILHVGGEFYSVARPRGSVGLNLRRYSLS